MDLLERAPLLEELGGVLAATTAGGRVVLVAGEAGIGKSALVKRFTERRSADGRFLLGACDPLLTPRALGPLHDIARQIGGRLAGLLASGAPREAVFAALLEQLAEPPRGQVVVVEDAHWADEATLDLLVFLGRRLERMPALLIVTYRDDELGPDHPLRGVLGVLPQGAVHRVRPQPLSEAAVAELARRAGRPAAGLRALTGGNPLLVTEVLAAGDAGVPMTVRDLVLARLAGLPADAQEVVRLVAVVPGRAELWLLEEALGPEPAAVERCVAAGLLVVGEDAAGFRHELLRQAVEGSLSSLGRRQLHRRVLRVLSEAEGRGVDIARLVHHAREAGDAEAVLRYAPEAARQAAAVAAHREAVGHYRAALDHADRLPPPGRAEHAWLSGDDDRVAEEAARVFERAVAAAHPWFAGELAFWLGLAGTPVPVPVKVAEPYRLLLAGDWRAAAAAWHELGCPYERALALAGGDRNEAPLEALALLDSLGARQTAQRLRRQLRDRGDLRVPRGPNRATAANPAGLTGRQAEVLELLCEGLTDAEIAARLSLSAKTVGHHVSALLAKLGVGSRRQASAAARRLGVVPARDGESGSQS